MRVLIALDGSELSELALAAVGPWIRELGFEAIVATVVDPDKVHETYENTASPYPIAPQAAASGTALRTPQPSRVVSEDRAQALEGARIRATEYLDACSQKYLQDALARSVVEWEDKPADALLLLADREKADVIVMGTHGRSGLSRLLMGSVAEDVLRRSPIPVIPIRSGMQLSRPPEVREQF